MQILYIVDFIPFYDIFLSMGIGNSVYSSDGSDSSLLPLAYAKQLVG